MASRIIVKGARTHNLRNLDVEIPRDRLVVVTGPSGSGKSSLAFDTIFAEGQRRYTDSLSSYVRQFLEQHQRPDVDSIEGLSPAIAIGQRSAPRNPRSSVGTVTEIHDALRLLWARVGQPHCWQCGRALAALAVDQMVDRVLRLGEGTRLSVLAPVVRDRAGDFAPELARARKDGFVRALVDGELCELADPPTLNPDEKHTIEIYVDRLVIKDGVRARLADSLELALRLGGGLVKITPLEGEDLIFSERAICPECGTTFPELSPRLFSWNHPLGACPDCDGMGVHRRVDPELIVRDPELSLREGAIEPWERRNAAFFQQILDGLATRFEIDLDAPWKTLPAAQRRLILHGSGKQEVTFSIERNGRRQTFTRPFEGVVANLQRRFKEHGKAAAASAGKDDDEELQAALDEMQRYMTETTCGGCGGTRLRVEARHVRLGGRTLVDVTGMTVAEAQRFFTTLELSRRDRLVADRVLREITRRLQFLTEVGADYLSLDRAAATLSGGEAQRIRLACQLGAGLAGVLYVLDEPSIGLHPRDTERLLATLQRLRDAGNTVLVVEHDATIIRAADHVIDMGPGAGELGGRVVASGPPEAIAAHPDSPTGQYLSGRRAIAPSPRRPPERARMLRLRGARAHNLRDVTLQIPLGSLTCISGVSGSGKSSLITHTLLPAARHRLAGGRAPAAAFDELDGLQHLDRVIDVDQSPIGRTSRSTPATYCGLFGPIRDVFAELPESRARGFRSGRFSFNLKGGRCERCQGEGTLRISMQFLPDAIVPCDVCEGRRYNRETLEVKYRGASIADTLDRTVTEALALFENQPRIAPRLESLREVGLGYVRLGQSSSTLSGGEAQRIKLANELGKRATGRTLYVLDEPTTGLHFSDVERLLAVLLRLRDAGNTLVVIEHNLDVLRCADWIVDMGPEGGPGGGRIVAEGTPEQVARASGSHTGRFLAQALHAAR